MRIRLPRSLASFVVCSFALLFLYVIGHGRVHAALGHLCRPARRTGSASATLWTACGKEFRAWRIGHVPACWFPARQRQEEQDRERPSSRPSRSGRRAGDRRRRPLPHPPRPRAPRRHQEVRIHEESPIGDYIYARLSSFYQLLLMVSFVPFLVYFMLSWRDHINRSFPAVLPRRGPAGGGAQPARHRRHGAGIRGRELPAGAILLAMISSVLFWCDAACRIPCWWAR